MRGLNALTVILLTLTLIAPAIQGISITSYEPEDIDITILNTQSQNFSINASSNGSITYRWYVNNELKYDVPLIEFAEDAFDLHAINFTNDFFIGGQDHHANGFTFNNDGRKLYILGLDNSKVYQYALPQAYDLSGMTFEKDYYLGNQDLEPSSIIFNDQGNYMFITGGLTSKIYQYQLSEAFDVSSAEIYQEFDSSNEDGLMLGISFANEGRIMLTTGLDNGLVYKYTLDPGYDIASASLDSTFDINAQEPEPVGLTFNNDGTIMYILGQTDVKIYEYLLSSPYDITTAVFEDSYYVGDYDQHPYDISFDRVGGKMFLLGLESNDIYESDLTYLITDIIYESPSLTISAASLGMGVFDIEAYAIENVSENASNASKYWELTIINPATASGGRSRVPTYEECVDSWQCDAWSECSEKGKQTRTCTYTGNCNRENSRLCALLGTCFENEEVKEKDCEYIPGEIITEEPQELQRTIGQLLDIVFGIRDNNISSADLLVAESEYISFGTEPARVNLTYIIKNSNNETVHKENAQIVVETELFVRKEFTDLTLPNGDYTLTLETLYGNNVKTDFVQEFSISHKPIKDDKNFWIVSLIIITLLVILINIIVFSKSKSK